MKKFLIPIDFSEGCRSAIKYAIFISGKEKTELHFIHIFPDQIMIPDSSFPAGIDSDAFMNSDFIGSLKNQSEQKMENFKQEIIHENEKNGILNIFLQSFVTGGDPEWVITDYCEQINPLMIIMGTRSDEKKGFLEGSLAEKIMIKSSVPVIAVPKLYRNPKLQNIMYATNFNQVDPLKIVKIFTLLRVLQFSVHVVHLELKGQSEISEEKMDELKSLFKSEFKDRSVEFHLLDSESKFDTLEDFISIYKIDLVAFIAHKNNIFKSLFSNKITKKDFFKLSLPMLALHEQIY